MTTKQPNLTAERCDECIAISEGLIFWDGSFNASKPAFRPAVTPDEAELFACRLLAAVKRARGEEE